MTARIATLFALAACTGDPSTGTTLGSDPDSDLDGDGLTASEEEELGLDDTRADADSDGLSDGDEVDLGTDPFATDTDGDGLLDGAEAEHGADPLLADTDDDGYTDRDEVYEGHDPADPEDRIYTGNWPYVYDKSVIARTAGDYRQLGNTFYRMQIVDQHGEIVDLYDYYNADKPVVIEISAEWCPPCNGLSSWIAGGDDAYNYGAYWENGPKAVKKGDVYWLSVLSEDIANRAPAPDLAVHWEELYPSKKIPVLSDGDQVAPDYAGLRWWPYVLLLEPDLTLSTANGTPDSYDFGSSVTVLQELTRRGL